MLHRPVELARVFGNYVVKANSFHNTFAYYSPMGGERGSTARQRISGKICWQCRNLLDPDPNHQGERLCAKCVAARTPKRKVKMHFYEMPMGLDVCFIENSQQLGKRLHYADPTRIYDLLRAAHCPVENHQIVELAIRERRPGSVDLSLTEQQYQKLKRSK